MKNKIISVEDISVDYGDARFVLYRMDVGSKKEEKDEPPMLHRHSFYEIHIVKKGAYTFWKKNGQVTAGENNILFIKPKYEHYSFLKEGENSISYIISLSVSKIAGEPHIFDMFLQNSEKLNMKPTKIPKLLEERAERFHMAQGTGVRGRLYEKLTATELLYSLLDFILPEEEEERKSAKNMTDDDIAIMLETLIDTNSNLSEISEMLGYSRRHMIRIIKKNFGMTYTELLKYRNLENAKKLLVNMPTLSIGTVSVMAGFKNESLFYKTFKKETGLTPGEYRRRYNG